MFTDLLSGGATVRAMIAAIRAQKILPYSPAAFTPPQAHTSGAAFRPAKWREDVDALWRMDDHAPSTIAILRFPQHAAEVPLHSTDSGMQPSPANPARWLTYHALRGNTSVRLIVVLRHRTAHSAVFGSLSICSCAPSLDSFSSRAPLLPDIFHDIFRDTRSWR